MARILIADDDEGMRALVRTALERDGHQVEEAPDGTLALESLLRRPPDLVITDVAMPRLDGYSLIEQMLKHDQLQNTPVIIITGHDHHYDQADAGKKRPSLNYFEKPFKPEDLAARVGVVLNQRRHT